MLTEVVRLLSDPRMGNGDGELVTRTGWRLLPFLVVTSTQLDLARCIARSPVLAKHPLTLNWARGNTPISCGAFIIKAVLSIISSVSETFCVTQSSMT